MDIKAELKGCWVIISTILGIIIVSGLLLFAVGTIGDIIFKTASVIQNNVGKILLTLVVIVGIVWIIKNKGED